MLNWKDDNTFSIDDILFTIDTTPGSKRRLSEEGNFTLVKPKKYIDEYTDLTKEEFNHVIELGMFQGGSIVFLDKLFSPKCLIGVEIVPTKLEALESYIEKESRPIKTFYGSSQDDVSLLKNIVQDEMGGNLDLVVDDASHLYEQSKVSLTTLFPLLKPNGLYIIEDWAWSHRPNAQESSHVWFDKPALTNLVVELVAELGRTGEIDNIYISNNMVKIRKAKNSISSPLFSKEAMRYRGLRGL